MARYGMVIDLNTCIGCNACTMACKAEHATPKGIFWAKVLEKEVGKVPAARRIFLPVLCNHCKNPICQEVCPTGATYKREDGIVLIDYDIDRKSTRLNSSHSSISYAVFCLQNRIQHHT